MVPVLKNVKERSTAKIYHPVSYLSMVSKAFEKCINNGLLISFKFFLIFNMVSGLLDQLQIF